MLRIALMLAALIIAAMPAALGVLRNTSFTQETPVRDPERSSSQMPAQRPDPKIDGLNAGKEDGDSGRTERRQAHNEGDDRPAHRQ